MNEALLQKLMVVKLVNFFVFYRI